MKQADYKHIVFALILLTFSKEVLELYG